MGKGRRREGFGFWRAGEVRDARKAREDQQVKIGSKRKVRFHEAQPQEEPEEAARGTQEGARPCDEWRPDQVAVAESAKRQRR